MSLRLVLHNLLPKWLKETKLTISKAITRKTHNKSIQFSDLFRINIEGRAMDLDVETLETIIFYVGVLFAWLPTVMVFRFIQVALKTPKDYEELDEELDEEQWT